MPIAPALSVPGWDDRSPAPAAVPEVPTPGQISEGGHRFTFDYLATSQVCGRQRTVELDDEQVERVVTLASCFDLMPTQFLRGLADYNDRPGRPGRLDNPLEGLPHAGYIYMEVGQHLAILDLRQMRHQPIYAFFEEDSTPDCFPAWQRELLRYEQDADEDYYSLAPLRPQSRAVPPDLGKKDCLASGRTPGSSFASHRERIFKPTEKTCAKRLEGRHGERSLVRPVAERAGCSGVSKGKKGMISKQHNKYVAGLLVSATLAVGTVSAQSVPFVQDISSADKSPEEQSDGFINTGFSFNLGLGAQARGLGSHIDLTEESPPPLPKLASLPSVAGVVPEPSTWALVGTGVGLLSLTLRRHTTRA